MKLIKYNPRSIKCVCVKYFGQFEVYLHFVFSINGILDYHFNILDTVTLIF